MKRKIIINITLAILAILIYLLQANFFTWFSIASIGLGIIGFVAALFDKNFSKDSRMTIMVMVVVATAIFEILSYTLNYMMADLNVEMINFIKILATELLYNLILTIIFYPAMQKFGYYIENEYKGNKILTRYF